MHLLEDRRMTDTRSARVPVRDAVLALAFMGDLSMGCPVDHSRRTAWLAVRIAQAAGSSREQCQTANDVALLRWSGCTANAAGFDALLGDDVGDRQRMLAMTLPIDAARAGAMRSLGAIHCEVSGDIAVQLGMEPDVEAGLRNLFEAWDGRGIPGRLSENEVPPSVYQVALASDLEILSRTRGLEAALSLIQSLCDSKYPAFLFRGVAASAPGWLVELDAGAAEASPILPSRHVPLELIADVADLKLPWLAGHSRKVADCAASAAALLGMDERNRAWIRRAGLIHALGRAALPNHVWERRGRLSLADREAIRLMPYWTLRAASLIPGIARDADLASYAYERLDGSGHHRSLEGSRLTMPQRVLAAAVAMVAMRSVRPWRGALDAERAAAILREEAAAGRFDPTAVDAVISACSSEGLRTKATPPATLSAREVEVLRRISVGESNKAVARSLSISPSTVRTHVESVFRKLACSTRAAATLKALTLGLI
jgi:HD-GYP domain-containing protein (c-di-GMP phosphodiesterase class II)